MRRPCHQCQQVRETGSQYRGRANADRTLHCSLDGERPWNLNWPFDGGGKGGEGDENGICPSFLAFIISLFALCLFMNRNLFPLSCCAPREQPGLLLNRRPYFTLARCRSPTVLWCYFAF